MKLWLGVMASAALLTGCQSTTAPVELNNVMGVKEKYEKATNLDVLSKHETIANLKEIKFHRCMGLTAGCPDKCGHSGNFAIFEIEEYKSYTKPGKYGDPKQKVFRVQLTDFNKKPLNDPVAKAVAKLSVGDRVELDWNHIYIDEKGMKYPVREVIRLKQID